MKSIVLRSTLVLAVIFLLPLGLFAETNTDDGAALSDPMMPVSSYDEGLQTDGHNPNYKRCQREYQRCVRFRFAQCVYKLSICLGLCEIDAICIGGGQGIKSCYQEE